MKLHRMLLALLLVLMCVSCFNVLADGTINVEILDDLSFDVKVSGTFDNSKRDWVNIVICEGKITSETYDAYTSSDKLTKTKFIRQKSFDDNTYSFTSGFDFPKGWYTAFVKYEGASKPMEKSFYYYKQRDMDDAIKEFNRILKLGEDGANEMKTLINSNIDGFFFDFENYISLTDSKRLSALKALDKNNTTTNITQIKKAVEKEALTAVICDLINKENFEEADKKILNNISLLKLDGFLQSTTYKNKDEEFRYKVLGYLKNTNIKDFVNNFCHQVVLTQIEKVDNAESITNILKEMSTSLDVDISLYNSSSKKSSVNSYIAGKKYDSIDKLVEAINEYISSFSSSSSSSSSGGSSGSKGSSVIIGNTLPVVPNTQKTPVFSDVPLSHWAYEAVETLNKNGIVSGYDGKTFAPDNKIIRCEFVKMVIAAFSLEDESAISDFNDVEKSHWSYKYIASAQKFGIVNGNENGDFLPNVNIKREEAAAIIYRIAAFKGYTYNQNENGDIFKDYNDISEYAKNSVSFLKQYNVLSGDNGYFNPKNFASRAEIAQMVYNTMKNLQLN